MASNEEILKSIHAEKVINWNKIFRQNPSIIESAYEAMDAARKDEAMAWEEWKRVHYIYSVIRHDMTVGLFYNKVRYSFDELYTIFKQQNS